MEIEIRGLDELMAKLESIGRLRGVEATVGNNTSYAPFVGSSRFQANAHRGRWVTDEQAIQAERAEIEADFQVAVQAGLDAVVIRENPLLVAARMAVLRLQARMAAYPPPRGTYRRTGTYGRRWTTRVEER